MDASAVPHFRGGPSAVAQTSGGRGRQGRGEAATMVDVTAGSGTGAAAGGLSLGEIGSAIMIWQENYPDAQPLFAVVFSALFLTGAALVHRARVATGACLIGVLCLFELVTFPGWTRRGALDWAYQCGYATLALAGLVTTIAVIVNRQRSSVSASTTS